MRQRKSRTPKLPELSDDGRSLDAPPGRLSSQQTVEVGAGGRLVIPAPMRAALGIKVGDKLTIRLEGNQLSVYTYQEGIRRMQERMRPYLPENAVYEFLRWKREEAAKEEAEFGGRMKDG